jgi:16S rRNA (guanine966-N2)-methyltransferase
MRIVAGKWAGRDLVSPGGRVRPTAEAVRDAWMNMLASQLEGARVLELFAGTGALGLEALSRGARYVDFVENGPSTLHALKANIAALRVKEKTRVYKRDAIPFAERLEAGRYDIALADPPYGSRMLDRLVEIWQANPFSTLLAVEHATDHVAPAGGRSYPFADTAVTVYPADAAVTPPPPFRPPPTAHARRAPDSHRRRR